MVTFMKLTSHPSGTSVVIRVEDIVKISELTSGCYKYTSIALRDSRTASVKEDVDVIFDRLGQLPVSSNNQSAWVVYSPDKKEKKI